MPQPLPSEWIAQALVHPFSEPQQSTTQEELDTPFFQLGIAMLSYSSILNALWIFVRGCSNGGNWCYLIYENGTTYVSRDCQRYKPVDMGWSFPTRQWLHDLDTNITAEYVGNKIIFTKRYHQNFLTKWTTNCYKLI